MTNKAKNCDECRYLDEMGVCSRGHKPRFYTSKRNPHDFGWKRRCLDFVARLMK